MQNRCCQLCGREAPLTRHHLIPRMRHRNPRLRKRFGIEELRRRIILVCHPCHRKIHSVFTEKALATKFNQLDVLAGHPEVRAFVQWIRNKPAGFRPKSRLKRR